MKRFILKFGLIGLASLTLLNILKEFAPTQYYWGNDLYKKKIEHLERRLANNTLNENVYFFGSSRIYRQINPLVFDSLVLDKKFVSFNLGSKGTFAPQSYYLYRGFLESELASHTDFVFLELSDIYPSGNRNLGGERSTYWQNWNDYRFILKSVFNNKSYSWKNKLSIVSTNSMSFFLKLFQFKQFKTILMEDLSAPSINDKGYYTSQGYRSLDEQLELAENRLDSAVLNKRKETLHNGKFDKNLDNAYEAFSESEKLDIEHMKTINRLIEVSKTKKIHLVFLLPPFRPSENLTTLYQNIDTNHRLEVTNPKRYPYLTKKRYFFDADHLNKNGATIFTKEVVDKFNTILRNK